MEIDEILQQLQRTAWPFPQEAVEEAVARREDITPELLRILEDTIDRASELAKDPEYGAHLYAMFLLAQFREARAYPLVVRMAALPGDVLEHLLGGFISESLHRVLASVCGGDVVGIRALIENDEIDEYVRGAALSSLLDLVAAGQIDRAEVVDYFGQLFRGKLRRKHSQVWNHLVTCCVDLYPGELMSDIEQAYTDELVDTSYIRLKDIEGHMADGPEKTLAKLSASLGLVENTAEEMEWWDCFQKALPREAMIASLPRPASPPPLRAREEPMAPTSPIVRDGPKVGRNDPCPCGSGKKYKKCCRV